MACEGHRGWHRLSTGAHACIHIHPDNSNLRAATAANTRPSYYAVASVGLCYQKRCKLRGPLWCHIVIECSALALVEKHTSCTTKLQVVLRGGRAVRWAVEVQVEFPFDFRVPQRVPVARLRRSRFYEQGTQAWSLFQPYQAWEHGQVRAALLPAALHLCCIVQLCHWLRPD